MLTYLVANFSGVARRETLHGRPFLVVPVTMLNPGVLNGSQGPLYYPEDETFEVADAWNGIPVLLNHPAQGSGRSPKVLNESWLGWVFNVSRDGKLRGEVWLDIERAKQVDSRIIPTVEMGKKIEVSTGLAVSKDMVPGTHNGKSYVGIARNHRPDHLAVLLDQKGACSIDDGCGINNSTTNLENLDMKKLTKQQKTDLVNDLVTNCDCWTEEDRDILNEKSDKELALFHNAMSMTQKAEKAEELLQAAQKGFKAGNDQYTLNLKTMEFERINNDDDPAAKDDKQAKPAGTPEDPSADPADPPASESPDPSKQPAAAGSEQQGQAQAAPAQNQRFDMNSLPTDIQEDLAFARKVKQQRKDQIIARLVENVASDLQDAQAQRLAKRPLEDLEEDLILLPIKNEQPADLEPVTNYQLYLGNAAGLNPTRATPVDRTPQLPEPVINCKSDLKLN